MKHYDLVIAGGGAAGLSLACHLIRSPLKNASILIVDQDDNPCKGRTFGFWSNQPGPFDEAVCRSWQHLQFVGEQYEKTLELGGYQYHIIRGLDFYRFARQELVRHANVDFVHGTVARIQDGSNEARVMVEQEVFGGQWVFDSLQPLSASRPDWKHYHHLKLHFKGWEIETPGPAFNPQAATLLDFRTPQREDVRFFYVLPYSERRALVEYTLFSAARLGHYECEGALEAYLGGVQGIRAYRVVRQEGGRIPITDQPYPRKVGERILTIGAKAGRVKPTTGYAFTRIQKDSAAIVHSLLQTGNPFQIPDDSRSYHLLDAILLDIMCRQGDQVKPIFTALFKHNPAERILRFLDEEASAQEILALIETLPRRIFLQALLRLQTLQQISWHHLRELIAR